MTTTTLFVAHQSASGNGIWYSFLGADKIWNDYNVPIGNEIFNGPACTAFQGMIYIAFRGNTNSDRNSNLWYMTFDGLEWIQYPVPVALETLDGPALAVYKDKLYFVFRGNESNGSTLYYVTYDGSSWSEQFQIKGAYAFSYPAAAVYDGNLYVAFQGTSQNSKGNLWISDYNGTIWSSVTQAQLNGLEMFDGPSILEINGKLSIGFLGNGNSLWLAINDSSSGTWQQSQIIPEGGGLWAASGPGLCQFENTYYCFFQGGGQGLWYLQSSDGVTWTQNPINGAYLVAQPSPISLSVTITSNP